MVLDETPGINLELDNVATYYSPFLAKLCSDPIVGAQSLPRTHLPRYTPIVPDLDPLTFMLKEQDSVFCFARFL